MNYYQSKISANNAINADSKKRSSFAAPLFAAGYGERRRAIYDINRPFRNHTSKVGNWPFFALRLSNTPPILGRLLRLAEGYE